MSKATTAKKNEKANVKASKAEATKKETKGKAFEPNVKVLSTIQVSPSKLRLVDKFRGRSADVAEEEVINLAEQIRIRQDQPIQVRAIEGTDEYEVIFGNTRTRAGKVVVEGFKRSDGKEMPAVADFTLRAEVVQVDDEEAILRNVTENIHRTATSAIDDAKNQEMLRTEYGMSDAAITRLYGYGHQASVTQLKKLMTLPEDFQQMIHRGSMTKQAGYVLVDWCKKKGFVDAETGKCQQAICDEVFKTSGSETTMQLQNTDNGIGSGTIAESIKAYEKKQRDTAAQTTTTPEGGTQTGTEGTQTGTEGSGTATTAKEQQPQGTTFALTLKDFKDTLTEFAGLPDVSAKTGEFCTMTLSFLKGEIEKDAYYDYVASLTANS